MFRWPYGLVGSKLGRALLPSACGVNDGKFGFADPSSSFKSFHWTGVVWLNRGTKRVCGEETGTVEDRGGGGAFNNLELLSTIWIRVGFSLENWTCVDLLLVSQCCLGFRPIRRSHKLYLRTRMFGRVNQSHTADNRDLLICLCIYCTYPARYYAGHTNK